MRNIEEKFSFRFRNLRRNLGLTQEAFLKRFNKEYNRSFTAAAISQYENGKRIPEIDALIDFADFFAVSVDYILGLSDCSSIYAQSEGTYVDVPVYSAINTENPALWVRDGENFVSLESEVAQSGRFSALKITEKGKIRTYIFRHQDTIPESQDAVLLHEGEPAFVARAVTVKDTLIVDTIPDSTAKVIGVIFKSQTLIYPIN